LARRKEAADILKLLVDDPALVSRTMIEDVLRYKRLDGVVPVLQTIAAEWFPNGRQARDLTATIAALPMPVQAIWGRNDKIVPAAHAAALPGAHLLDGAGHLPHMEKSAEVSRLIRRLIGP
jgi:pyruvate dehydrogenase E2 component (dihydrolipoamide acetyltransferase)